jgi:tripartite-type tricarboxylate transporter receptor subunit TctC
MRRILLCALLLPAGAALAASPAATYPAKPIRYVVGFTPGGPSDIVARLIGGRLADHWGQQVVVDNRPGAGGNVAGEIVARAAPDGYTLLMGNNSILATNQSLYRKLGFDPLRDFAPVVLLARQPNILVVHPSLPVHSVRDLVAVAKSKPGALNYASSGAGAAAHLSGELFKSMAGVDLVHIPYKGGGPALTDVIAGQAQVMFATAVSVQGHIRSGRVRAIAVTTERRSVFMPDLPTIAESGLPGFEATTWHGIVVTAGSPPDIVAKLNQGVNAALNDPVTREKLEAQGAEVIGGTPQAFGAYIRREIPKWAKVVKDSGARAD